MSKYKISLSDVKNIIAIGQDYWGNNDDAERKEALNLKSSILEKYCDEFAEWRSLCILFDAIFIRKDLSIREAVAILTLLDVEVTKEKQGL